MGLAFNENTYTLAHHSQNEGLAVGGRQALFWIFQHFQAAIGTPWNRHQMEYVWLTRSQFSHLTQML